MEATPGQFPPTINGSLVITSELTVNDQVTVDGPATVHGQVTGDAIVAAVWLDIRPVAGSPGIPETGWRLYCDSNDGNKLKAICATGSGTPVLLATPPP